MPVTEKDLESFNPRTAALYHAAEARIQHRDYYDQDISNFANAIVSGLIYVGDQIRRANLIAEYDALRRRAKDGTQVKVTKRLRELDGQLWPIEEGGE